jgi:hypothetical protein
LRVNAPGYGPKIINYEGSLDLSALVCFFTGAGAPAAATLLAGNGKYILNDLYLDTMANALYRCTANGTNNTARWAQIAGGGAGGYKSEYNPFTQYLAGQTVRVSNTFILNGVTVFAGTYGLVQDLPALNAQTGAAGTQIPQFPEPIQNKYWELMSFGPQILSNCASPAAAYINATSPINL